MKPYIFYVIIGLLLLIIIYGSFSSIDNFETINIENLKVFIIHYKKLTERKDYMIKQLDKHNITNYEFIEIDRDELTDQQKMLFEKDYNNAQIAITLSHMKAYYEIFNKYDYGLILEDDAIFADAFIEKFKLYTNELPNDYDMLFFGGGGALKIMDDKLIEGRHIYENPDSRCTDSYLISKECAKKMVNHIENMDYKINLPVDWWLKTPISNIPLKIYWAEPQIVRQGSENGEFAISH